ncbi:nucleotidyltransferase domain-containing protein, partial [Candidatus Fermentibacteria bacterium]|nr:nucleotidyltransferase domain-containing protein [Candidatus Fermentibacteria bacterium]
FQGAELIRLAASGVGAVQRELKRLVSSDLVVVIPAGRQKRYQANRNCPVFDELHGLVIKTVGLALPITNALEPMSDRILSAFIYGSIAKGSDRAGSDIDLMIIGDDLSYPKVLAALQPVENVVGRQISVNLMKPAEWIRRMTSEDSFVSRIMSQQKIILIGSEDVIESTR